MNGPSYILVLLLAGGFAFGVALHGWRALRSNRRGEHGLLAVICLISSAFLLISARQMLNYDVDAYLFWYRISRFFSGAFLVLYPFFVARTTGSRGIGEALFFGLVGVVFFWHNLHEPSGPWLTSIDRIETVVLPWGEPVAVPRGPDSPWRFVAVAMWGAMCVHGIWRATRSRADGLIGARALLWSNALLFVILIHEALVMKGVLPGPLLAHLVPAVLTGGVWWRLSLVDRQRVDAYHDLFARSGDAIMIHDAGSGGIVEANDAACRLFRRTQAELVGATLASIISPDEPLPLNELAQRVGDLRQEGAVVRERRLRRLDGSGFTAEVALRLARLDGRERIVASFRDLTDRVRVEQALVENERRLRTVIARSPIAIIEATPEGRVVALNPRFAELFGHRAGDAFSLDFFADPEDAVPAVGGTRLERWRRLLANARAGEGVIRSFRAALDDRQGRRREVDICGVLGGESAVLFVTDLTDELAARDEIARREAFYRALVEVASDGLCVLDLGGQGEPSVAVWNPRLAALTGQSAAQAASPGWIDRASDDPHARERLRSLVARMREGTLRDEPWDLVRRDGATRACSITAVPLPRAIGDRRMLVTVRDVTELARAERDRRNADAELRHAQKLESLGILAGGIAHDFNNILMPILGRAALMGSRLGMDHPARGQLRDMEQASRRAAELCQQLLAYAGKGRARAVSFSLGALVAEMARMLSVSSTSGARLPVELDEQLPPIAGDPSQVRQVVMNLITNAIDASGPGAAPVALRVRRLRLERAEPVDTGGELAPGDYVALEVVDHGCGMDEATRRRVFEPFFTTKPTGRGLGMAAVLGVVRGHGGGLRIETAPERGTTMRVLFPVAAGPLPDRTPSVGVPTLAHGGMVLVVDDEDSIRRTTRDMLLHLDFEVLVAGSGAEAVAEFTRARERIRAVVLDLTMPDMDGAETLRRLHAIDPRVRVIVASGYSRDEVARTLSDVEVAAFLQKPYDVEALANALHAALGPAADDPARR